MSHLTKYEKETILLTSEGDDTYSVYTFNPGLKRKDHSSLLQLVIKNNRIKGNRILQKSSNQNKDTRASIRSDLK